MQRMIMSCKRCICFGRTDHPHIIEVMSGGGEEPDCVRLKSMVTVTSALNCECYKE